jgi:N-acetylglucosamine repressor
MHENRSYRDFDPGGIYPERVEANPMQRVRLMHREVVLNIVRACQPVSRRDIARQSGLQECTVGVIVKELIREGMMSEELARTSRGRPPSLISIGEKCDLSVLDLNLE